MTQQELLTKLHEKGMPVLLTPDEQDDQIQAAIAMGKLCAEIVSNHRSYAHAASVEILSLVKSLEGKK